MADKYLPQKILLSHADLALSYTYMNWQKCFVNCHLYHSIWVATFPGITSVEKLNSLASKRLWIQCVDSVHKPKHFLKLTHYSNKSKMSLTLTECVKCVVFVHSWFFLMTEELVLKLGIQDKPKVIDLTRKAATVDTLTETHINCRRNEKVNSKYLQLLHNASWSH